MSTHHNRPFENAVDYFSRVTGAESRAQEEIDKSLWRRAFTGEGRELRLVQKFDRVRCARNGQHLYQASFFLITSAMLLGVSGTLAPGGGAPSMRFVMATAMLGGLSALGSLGMRSLHGREEQQAIDEAVDELCLLLEQ